jgi:hypothetical protein
MIFDQIWRLERIQRKFERRMQEKMNIVLKDKSIPGESVDAFYEHAARNIALYEQERQRLLSERLRTQATRLNLPVPAESEWIKPGKGELPFMSPAMQTELRKAIRQEQKERREMWTTVVKDIIAPIGGIIISIGSLMIAYAALKLKQ